jgi:MFS transporter, ACS family, glucarate transporter
MNPANPSPAPVADSDGASQSHSAAAGPRTPSDPVQSTGTPPTHDPSQIDLSSSEPATGTRYRVLGVLCLLSAILYLDRICLGKALPLIKEDLGLTNTEGSFIALAFTVAYGLFEVPTGSWGDRIGARAVLTRISLWWSAFTALTGACTSLWSLLVVRFLFGAGEAGAFPNVARVLAVWFPDHERGRAQGILLAASQIGGALAPFVAALMIQWVGWRWMFVVFGSLGVVWAAGFWWWFRDDPKQHPQVNDRELKVIGKGVPKRTAHDPIPWRLVFRCPSVWLLSAIMTFASFNSYLYFTWFPTYLEDARGMSNLQAGWLSTVVGAGAAVGTLLAGQLLDRFIHGHGDHRRRWLGGLSYTLAAGFLVLALSCESAMATALFSALSCLMTQATLPLWWSCAIGISGRHVGALFGLMNSMGLIGAGASQLFAGVFSDYRKNAGFLPRDQWDPIFYVDAVVLLAAAACWACMVVRPVEPPEASSPAPSTEPARS